MDGNYSSTLQMRVAVADTIILLDTPRRISCFRVFARYLKYRGKTRPDLGEGCTESIDLEFIKWIWDYPNIRRPRTLRFVEKLRESKNVYFLRNQKEIEEFVVALRFR